MVDVLDVAVRFLLVACSMASFAPQISRIKNHGSFTGISVSYVLYNTILATYSFALILWAALNHEGGNYFMPEKPGIGDWLNLAQFTAAWLGQLYMFYLILTLPPTRPGKTCFATIACLMFLAISLGPVIVGTVMGFDSETDRDWFYSLFFFGPTLYLIGPLVQILGFAAFWAQASEIRRSASSENALSVRGLVRQAVVFLLVGMSFVWRIRIPDEELYGYWIVDLRKWYWTVGWATVNNLIFAVTQGLLAWIAWHYKGDKASLGERSALLE